jgi:LacI family transcriptional regulator
VKQTVYTIADDMGVAPSTISKIINRTGNFSDELRVKVLEYIRQVGYVPSTSARVLKSKKSWNIGIIYTEESRVGLEHPFFSIVLQSFKEYTENVGYVLSFIVKKIGNNEMTYLNWCRNLKVDGVLVVVGSHNNPDLIELLDSDIPVVSTDVVREKLHTIVSDNEQGIRLSIDYALSLGKKRIGMISGPVTARHFLHRLKLYKEILTEKKIPIDENLIISAKGFGYSSGFETATTLLGRSAEKPDFILVGSDLLAFGAIHAIESQGLNVPKDISVIGFDDISFARMFKPSLTTIRQNAEVIGSMAAKELIHKIDQNLANETKITTIPVELVIRDSTL